MSAPSNRPVVANPEAIGDPNRSPVVVIDEPSRIVEMAPRRIRALKDAIASDHNEHHADPQQFCEHVTCREANR